MTSYDVKMSLYHFVKTIALPSQGFISRAEDEILTPVDVDAGVYSFANKGVAYADPSGRMNPSGVRMMDGGSILPMSEYSVNYVDATITLSIVPSGAVSASYDYWPVNVVDAFPDADEFDNAALPLLAVDIESSDPTPFAVGYLASKWEFMYFMDLFATSDPMRMRVSHSIQRCFAPSIPMLDFTVEPLMYDGSINPAFDWDAQLVTWCNMKKRPKCTMLNMSDVSEKERYRAALSGTLTIVST
jgi:hypothetical protein